MATTGAKSSTPTTAMTRFEGSVAGADVPRREKSLARIVTTGSAATVDRRDVGRARAILVAALEAMRGSELHAEILVTPAGFVDHKPGGRWSGSMGWKTTQSDFDLLAAVAANVAREVVTPEVRRLASRVVAHLIIGVDVWPTDESQPHAEVACHVDVERDAIVPITGKTYPNAQQQDVLIRNPDVASHVVQIGGERVAVLVCHDLAAWSPRGNAVAKGERADTWRAMQSLVAAERPSLVVQLPHTVSTAATWRPAWARLAERSGGAFRSGTSAIRHLDKHWHEISQPPDSKLLAGTGRGERAIDVVVTEVPA